MSGVNKAILIGNLGKDPEVRVIENDRKVAKFSMATSESWKDKTTGERVDKTEWHNIVLWRGLADIAEKYLKKGDKVYIEGRIRTRSYEKDGVTKYFTEIQGDNMTMLSPKGGEMSGTPVEDTSQAGETGESAAGEGDKVAEPAPDNIKNDKEINELPF
ncbi:MAG: single-stranded DNA-binding protein [Cytophagales bacterium]|nr:single-stranded DNA-binding protein [Cytophagales bacterium]